MGPAGRKTLETLGAADSITEALEMAATEVQRQQVILSCCCTSCGIASQCSTHFTPVAHLDMTWLVCMSAACSPQNNLQSYPNTGLPRCCDGAGLHQREAGGSFYQAPGSEPFDDGFRPHCLCPQGCCQCQGNHTNVTSVCTITCLLQPSVTGFQCSFCPTCSHCLPPMLALASVATPLRTPYPLFAGSRPGASIVSPAIHRSPAALIIPLPMAQEGSAS